MRVALLVVAKMPVPGRAKTRLAERVGSAAAADLAAAALLDTLSAVAGTGLPCVVACTGERADAARRDEIDSALGDVTVVAQRGSGLGARLSAAHHDAARLFPGHRVLQIGMDTPQAGADLLTASARRLLRHHAVIGPAADGGWWAIGVATPRLTDGLTAVPMSSSETGRATLAMLEEQQADTGRLPELRDVDTWDDAREVGAHPDCGPRFATALAALATEVP